MALAGPIVRRPPWLRLGRSAAAGTAAVVAAILVACGPSGAVTSPGPSADPDAIRVVTTTTVLADLVRAVGGSRVDVTSIVPAGAGPEDYEPKPDDARRLADARLIVSNGAGLDDFLDRLLSAGGTSSARRLVLAEGLATIIVDGQPNPHCWLDPTIVRDGYLPRIAAALGDVDPAGRPAFAANLAAYGSRLTALDSELGAQVATIASANRKLVTTHDAFPYFAGHFGFQLIGVVVPNPGQEPTAAQLATLVETVKASGVRAVFSEAQFSPKLAQTLADEAGDVRVVSTIYTDSLGPAPADTYLGLMRSNMGQIVEALR